MARTGNVLSGRGHRVEIFPGGIVEQTAHCHTALHEL